MAGTKRFREDEEDGDRDGAKRPALDGGDGKPADSTAQKLRAGIETARKMPKASALLNNAQISFFYKESEHQTSFKERGRRLAFNMASISPSF